MTAELRPAEAGAAAPVAVPAEVLAAVVAAVAAVLELPAAGPATRLDGVDSVDLVEIVLRVEEGLARGGTVVTVPDETLAGWPDVAAFAANVARAVGGTTSRRPGASVGER